MIINVKRLQSIQNSYLLYRMEFSCMCCAYRITEMKIAQVQRENRRKLNDFAILSN